MQTGLARGAPFDLSTLARVGVSPPLAARYAESGWLVRLAIHERAVDRTLQAKMGRNEPCPCGSGKKFKKCCGAPADSH